MQTIFPCLPLVVVVSSLALPPVSVELYSISAEICVHWALGYHSNGGCEVTEAVSRKSAIYRDWTVMWSVSMKKDLVYFVQ